eukprot:1806162-Pyramimonas_sp.AAC.1
MLSQVGLPRLRNLADYEVADQLFCGKVRRVLPVSMRLRQLRVEKTKGICPQGFRTYLVVARDADTRGCLIGVLYGDCQKSS